MIHFLEQARERTRDGYTSGVGVRLAERDRHFFIALLQLDARDDRFAVRRLQPLQRRLVPLHAFAPDRVLQRRRSDVGVRIVDLDRNRPALDAADLVPDAIERYAEEHTSPPTDLLARLAEETKATLECPAMLTGPVEGRFLQQLVFATGAKRVLELGTYSGYSSISMAAGLTPGGHIDTCEVDEKHAEVARAKAEGLSLDDAARRVANDDGQLSGARFVGADERATKESLRNPA